MASFHKYKNNIRSGDIIIFGSNKLISFKDLIPYIIRFFSVSEYYHMGVAWVHNDKHFIIEANPPKTTISRLEPRIPFYHVALNVDWTDDHFNWLFDKLGLEYPLIQAISAYFTKPEKDMFFICTELVNDWLIHNGHVLELENYRPSTLVNQILELPKVRLVRVNE